MPKPIWNGERAAARSRRDVPRSRRKKLVMTVRRMDAHREGESRRKEKKKEKKGTDRTRHIYR